MRLWLTIIAYNLGNLWRRLALPQRIGNWSLTSLQQRLVKTGGRLIKHARYYPGFPLQFETLKRAYDGFVPIQEYHRQSFESSVDEFLQKHSWAENADWLKEREGFEWFRQRRFYEGNILQGVSRTLLEEVPFDATEVKNLDWKSYPILTFQAVPNVEIVLINRPEMQPLGGGEPSTVPIAAAIANAIFDAVDVRLGEVPLTPQRVRSALKAGASPTQRA